MSSPVLVADFAESGSKWSPRELIDRASERGATLVAVDVVDEEDVPQAHLGGRLVGTLARLAAEGLRGRLGLFLRLHDTLSIEMLRQTLDVSKGASAAALKDRFLVVVDGERTGKRLRRVAPELPSALALSSTPRRGLARFVSPNMLRAAADADDVVVPWNHAAPALVARLAPKLAKRGAHVWVAGVPEAEAARARAMPVAGVVVRFTA